MYSRRPAAILFHQARKAGGCTSEEKICISACGDIHEWHDDLYGVTRVVVYGEGSLCAVCRTEDLERAICQAKKAHPLICNVHNALIYEADDLTLPCGEVGKMTSRRIEKPFVAVSVAPSTNSGHEASGAEYNVDSAIKFLKEEMGNGATSTFLGSLKTAVFTLDRLFGKEFEADEIKVFSVNVHEGRGLGLSRCGLQVTEYPIRGERCVKDHLDAIHEPCSGGSSSGKWKLAVYKPSNGSSCSGKWRLDVINKAQKRSLDVIKKALKRRLDVKATKANKAHKRRLDVIKDSFVNVGGSGTVKI